MRILPILCIIALLLINTIVSMCSLMRVIDVIFVRHIAIALIVFWDFVQRTISDRFLVVVRSLLL